MSCQALRGPPGGLYGTDGLVPKVERPKDSGAFLDDRDNAASDALVTGNMLNGNDNTAGEAPDIGSAPRNPKTVRTDMTQKGHVGAVLLGWTAEKNEGRITALPTKTRKAVEQARRLCVISGLSETTTKGVISEMFSQPRVCQRIRDRNAPISSQGPALTCVSIRRQQTTGISSGRQTGGGACRG